MNLTTANKVNQCFFDLEKNNPSKSTEWLISMTADTLGMEYSDVVECLAMIHDKT
jgi:hypothetical protein